MASGEVGEADSLQNVLATAHAVRVVAGGQFDERNRKQYPTLVHEQDEVAVRELAAALQVRTSDFAERYALMTPGDLTLAFFGKGQELLTTVTVLFPDFLRWREWPGDAGLTQPAKLRDWLTQRGWEPSH
jgi:hypothetical protein